MCEKICECEKEKMQAYNLCMCTKASLHTHASACFWEGAYMNAWEKEGVQSWMHTVHILHSAQQAGGIGRKSFPNARLLTLHFEMDVSLNKCKHHFFWCSNNSRIITAILFWCYATPDTCDTISRLQLLIFEVQKCWWNLKY